MIIIPGIPILLIQKNNQNEIYIYLDLYYRHLKEIVSRIGIPETRFHDLRHTYATLAIMSGDDIKTVSENMGHYSTFFTMDTYAHVTAQMRDTSAERMERMIKSL